MADLGRIFLLDLEQPGMSGVLNAVAPYPVTNATLMKELRQALHRSWTPPAPGLAVRLGALLMGSNAQLALTGQRCEPKRLLEQRFSHDFARLDAALYDLLHCREQATGAHTESQDGDHR